MDFFTAQDRARRRTGRLVVLFAFALLGTVAALYGAALLILRVVAAQQSPGAPGAIWRPELLGGVAAFTLLVAGVAALSRWLKLRAGGPAVAELVGGRRVEPDTTDLHERTLLNVVEEMALASGVPTPAVYILPDEPAINAFAAGYSPGDAAVAVTDGALARLSRDELQGVVAHEFSHILNGDMRLNTRLSALVFGILALSVVGRVVLRSAAHARVSSSSRREKGGGVVVLFLAGLALLVVGYIGYLFGKLIQAAVSRQREFLADAAAVQFTRNPAGIAGALKKLGGSALEGRLQNAHAGEVSHFCFAQNFRSAFGGLFSTHPPLEQRIRAVEPGWDGRYVAGQLEPRATPPRPSANAFAAADHPRHAAVLAALGQSTPGRLSAAELLASAGQLSPAAVAAARAFHSSLPEALHAAAHDPAQVAALACALCLPHAAEPAALTPLLALVAARATPAEARRAADLHAALAPLPAAHLLPLLQLSAPALRQLDARAAATLIDTLQVLAHADGALTPHEFALQKIVSRTLGLAARPRDAIHVLAPNQVTGELSVALSAAARIDATDETAAAQAFARAAVEFNGLQPPITYRPADAATWDDLDLALEHLAHTPAPFRKRVLSAFATALTADSRLTQQEADLFRAIAAALDCPLPPVLAISP